MWTTSRIPAAFLVAAVLFVAFLAVPAFAQVEDEIDANMEAALHDLSQLYGSPVVRIDQARAICNQERYMVECAAIGKKHGLFGKERQKEVDSILTKMKGRVVEELKQCGDTECLISVATKIAKELSASNPALARTVDLTPQDVQEKRSIVEVSKEVGVDFEACRTMDPDTASVELLRSCAKLAKHERIQEYIPEEHRIDVEKTEKTAELKEALAAGQIQCGDGTLDGCGTFCLNPTAAQREEGLAAIPPICRQIAEQFFGPEGVRELERVYTSVQRTYDEVKTIYKERETEGEIRPIDEERRGAICTASEDRPIPCPAGQYRQGAFNELGCYVFSECIPFNTETQPEKKENDKQVICPAMPTVDSCPAGEEKVVTYSSPECGTYYTCRPKPEERTKKFPFVFKSGRAVVSFAEARIYCYESGSRGATARGDTEECLQAFGIKVPDIPPEKQCKEWGNGWHTMDGSGNCFNEEMSEYRTKVGELFSCRERPVYGCKTKDDSGEPPAGQKEQVWNSLGLRSWVRADASESRVADLKAACGNVRAGGNVWLRDAGTYSSSDFGMPDPDKCKKAAACGDEQYFNGSECSEGFSTKPQCSDGKDNDSDGKIDYPSDTGCYGADDWDEARESTADVCSAFTSESSCKTKAECSWTATMSYYGGYCALTSTMWTPQCSDGKDNDGDGKVDYGADSGCTSKTDDLEQDNVGGEPGMRHCFYQNATINGKAPGYSVWCEADYYNCREGSPSGASVSLAGLSLGAPSQCESWGEQNRPTCPPGEYWDGSACKSQGPTVSGSCSSDIKSLLGSGCHSMGNAWFNGAMTLYILPGSTYLRTCTNEKISGCGGSHTNVSCPSGQFWSGSSCVSSEGTICASNEYWDAGKGGCTSSARACAQAGGSWDSTKNFCEMPQPKTPTPTPTTQTVNQTGTVTSGGSGTSSMKRCFYPNASVNGTHPGYTVWCEADYYNCHVGEPSGAVVSLTGLSLGAPSSCESGWSSGSSGSGVMYSWNSYGLSSMIREDADPARLASLKQACANVKSSSANIWMPNAGTYSSPDFGMPDPDKCTKAASCTEGQYFNGTDCGSYSSGGSSSPGGGGCYTYTSQSSCQAASCYWITSASSPYCSDYANDTGGSSNSGSTYCGSGYTWNGSSCMSSCGSGQYWNGSNCVTSESSGGGGGSGTMDYSSMQSGCASAGGTWDSSGNYCRMPTSYAGSQPLAFLCPENHLWNGSYCSVTKERGNSFLASVLQAFLALFGK